MMNDLSGYLAHSQSEIHHSVIVGLRSTVWQFATICRDTVIGEDCVVGSSVWIGRNCRIGNRVRIQHGAFVPNGTILEDDVFVGPNVTMTDDKYPRSGNHSYIPQPPTIRRGASLGAGAIILPGVVVGPDTMVAAGAVVTKSIDGHTLIGMPARSTG